MIGRQIRSVEKSRFQHPGSLSLSGGPWLKTLSLFTFSSMQDSIIKFRFSFYSNFGLASG